MKPSLPRIALSCWLAWSVRAGGRVEASEPPSLETGSIHFDTITVGTDPFHATSDYPVRLVVSGVEEEVVFGCPYYRWNPPEVHERTIVFDLDSFGCPSAGALPAAVLPRIQRTWDLGLLEAGVYEVRVITDDFDELPLAVTRVEIHQRNPVLRLREGFQVWVERPTAGPLSTVLASPLSSESGVFSFFAPTNVEVTVKVLDGRAINGHYWVFLASMTDQPFVATVLQDLDHCLDLPTDPHLSCPWRSYSAPAGENRNFIDVEFPLTPPRP
jgi:hypothetical protein